jgi:hypothetical protein
MKNILRIENIEGGLNVVFSEDGGQPLVCQVYDTDGPQHFTWAEVQVVINNDPGIIDRPLPPPPPVPLTVELKAEYKAKITAQTDVRRARGFQHSGNVWQADKEAQANLNAYMTLIQAGLQGPFIWRDIANVNNQLTQAEIVSLAGAMMQYVQTLYLDEWTAKDQVMLASTVAEAEVIMADLDAK